MLERRTDRGGGIVANVVNHFEIHGTDGKKAQDFYASLCGWSVDANNPMNYGMVSGEVADLDGIAIGLTQSGTMQGA